jgi:hypothetical protein
VRDHRPLQPPARDKRDRRLAACAHTFGYRGHLLTKSRRYFASLGALRQGRADHVREQLLADGDDAQRELVSLGTERRVTRLTSSVSVISQPPTPTSPLKLPPAAANTATWRAKRSTTTTTELTTTDARHRRI